MNHPGQFRATVPGHHLHGQFQGFTAPAGGAVRFAGATTVAELMLDSAGNFAGTQTATAPPAQPPNTRYAGTSTTMDSYQCFVKQQQQSRNGKIMVDAATMTDPVDESLTTSWPGVTTPNTKVAEYLTSLRQFLKLSTPSEGKRRLGDVKIVNSADGTRLYCCPECHMAYPDKSLLEPHLASHKIERRFVCGVCGAGLKRKEHLDRHQLSHSDERPYSCAACPKTFKRNEHLARHYIVHSGEKAQVCPECGKAFYRKDHLRKHAAGHLAKRLRLAAIAS